jgi:hypothetical protein
MKTEFRLITPSSQLYALVIWTDAANVSLLKVELVVVKAV